MESDAGQGVVQLHKGDLVALRQSQSLAHLLRQGLMRSTAPGLLCRGAQAQGELQRGAYAETMEVVHGYVHSNFIGAGLLCIRGPAVGAG